MRLVVWGDVPKVTALIVEQVRPEGVEAETVKVTVPANPFSAVTVIVCEP